MTGSEASSTLRAPLPIRPNDVANKAYVDASSGASPLTTKGDVFGHSNVDARIAIGADNDVLTADAAQALGLKWAAPSGGAGQTFFAVTKNADETVNNSNTLQDDDDFVFAAAANKSYSGYIILWMTSDTKADFKFAFTVPTAATGLRLTDTWNGTNDQAHTSATSATVVQWSFTTRTMTVQFRFVIGANAGNVNFQWAQKLATVEDTKMLQGSMILAWEG